MSSFKIRLISVLVIFSLFCTAVTAQSQSTYEKDWNRVSSLIKKNRPGSAMQEVQKIYQQAKNDQNDIQVIRALLYIAGLQSPSIEQSELYSIRDIEKEIATAKQPARAILTSILADAYLAYYRKYYWQNSNRTSVAGFRFYDVSTWAPKDFHQKITELYLQSLQPDALLKQTPIAAIEPIIVAGNTRVLRPTLYDQLAHRALRFFSSEEINIPAPVNNFQITDTAAFAPVAEFVKIPITATDSFSPKLNGLRIIRDLVNFHLNDSDPSALIDADISRMEFLRNKSVSPYRFFQYYKGLTGIVNQYPDHPAAAQAWYLIAVDKHNKASGYKVYGDSTYRLYNLEAVAICEKVLLQRAESEGKINCYNLCQEIKRKELDFEVEKVNTSNKPFRVFVKYYNLPKIYFKLIPAPDALAVALSQPKADTWKILTTQRPVSTWEQPLPGSEDLQPHSTEIKIDQLPSGRYWLIAGTDKALSNKESVVVCKMFHVSQISHIHNGTDHFILDRETGAPLNGATVEVEARVYNKQTRRYSLEKMGVYQTGADGHLKLEPLKTMPLGNFNHTLDIRYKEEVLNTKDLINVYIFHKEESHKEELHPDYIHLFSDRKIYRPGQLVYLKGVALIRSTSTRPAGVKPGYETTVYLRNANYQLIDSAIVTTNEFGSFTSSFQLPETGLTGNFSIRVGKNIGYLDFRVEEYKRPKFKVEYEPIKGSYKLNDSVRVTGFAKAFAGNNIDKATVKYRVVRSYRIPYSWRDYGSLKKPLDRKAEITHGTITTGTDGKFNIDFKAEPDLFIEKEREPIFIYTVYADVTDINGETRSASKIVNVSYRSIILVAEFPDMMRVDSFYKLSIRSQNMNGNHEPRRIKVVVTPLLEEKRLIRSRYWHRPDQFVMNKQEYLANFPHDEYDQETNFKTWSKGAPVLVVSDSSRENGKFNLAGSAGPGHYMIEISTHDKDGTEIKDIQYIQLFDHKSNRLTSKEYLWYEAAGEKQPGKKAIIGIGTSADSVHLIRMVSRNNDHAFSSLVLNNEKKAIDFDITESDRGGFGLSWAFVKHNRVYQRNDVVQVPWSNKELQVEYMSFRDKALPGSEETWKLKITGHKKEKVATELLAAMYDASLDDIYMHQWDKPAVWKFFSTSRFWESATNFTAESSGEIVAYTIPHKRMEKHYDNLLSTYVFSPSYQGERSVEPLWWANPLDYAYSEARNPRLMRLPKRVFRSVEEANEYARAGGVLPDSDGDGLTDQFDDDMNPGNGFVYSAKKTSRPGTIKQGDSEVTIRKNFNETAFFMPQLRTDSTGMIEFSFTLPESLTKWKFNAFSHTREAAFALSSRTMITQKQLMVQPNAPRFLREQDKIDFSTKVVNLTDSIMKVEVELVLIDPETNKQVNDQFKLPVAKKTINVGAQESGSVFFPIEVQPSYNRPLTWRVIAKSGNYSDGEENTLPVLSNRILVTESVPLVMKGMGKINFVFERLAQPVKSNTHQDHSITVEYTTNPEWHVIKALPYLAEFPYECAEQLWNRYYANAIASRIVNNSPRLKAIFEIWKSKDDIPALHSNLQKNPELKSILLEETPWVLEAASQTAQQKNLALLFDVVHMSKNLNSAADKIIQTQTPRGGFSWFKEGPEDRYITQYILSGIGHLRKINAYGPGKPDHFADLIPAALTYLDKLIRQDYEELKKGKTALDVYVPHREHIQYLYMRSFFPEHEIDKFSRPAYDYFYERATKSWIRQQHYMQGMIALASYRYETIKGKKDFSLAKDIMISLKENSVYNEELGRYWKNDTPAWYWHNSKIETQALLAEAFQEIGPDPQTANEIRAWLLNNKQTRHWPTTKATAEACYAILLDGKGWLKREAVVEIKLGERTINSLSQELEAGTEQLTYRIPGEQITPALGNIQVSVTAPSGTPDFSSRGTVYWQYFEDMNKITAAATPLKLVKRIFVERNSNSGPLLTEITAPELLKVGDKVRIRLEITVDRELEYLHLKDLRAASLEPVNVLSGRQSQGGVSYYLSPRDVSMNFFFHSLPMGVHVIEYPMFVTHTGNFTNGIATIQCMYAPEFGAHSGGTRVTVR